MKKATIKLFDVHPNFKVKFTTFIESEPMTPTATMESKSAISKFSIGNNEYISIMPSSYVVIDISTKQDKGNNYSSNTSFSLDRRKLLLFILKLEKLYRCFTEEKNLFFIDSNKGNQLSVNHDISSKHKEILQVCGQKTLQMEPCVYIDKDDLYEGIYIAVNSLNYNSNLTYDQLYYLIYELKRIDFSSLEIGLINTALAYEKTMAKPLKVNKTFTVQQEEPEIQDTKKRIKIEDVSVIPNI